MGRKYEGKDYEKITVRLTKDETEFLGKYCRFWYDLRTQADPETAKPFTTSDAIHNAITTLQGYLYLSSTIREYAEMSDNMKKVFTDCANDAAEEEKEDSEAEKEFFTICADNMAKIETMFNILCFSLMADQDSKGKIKYHEYIPESLKRNYSSLLNVPGEATE